MVAPKIVNSLFDNYPPLKWWEKLWYSCCRKYSDAKYFFRKIYQRFKYGFPLYQAWDFKSWHANIVLPRLEHLKNNLNGHPCVVESIEKWEEILDKIIWAFEHHDDFIPPVYSEDFDHRHEITEEDHPTLGKLIVSKSMNTTGTVDWSPIKNHQDKVQEGLDLFAKYYVDLWD